MKTAATAAGPVKVSLPARLLARLARVVVRSLTVRRVSGTEHIPLSGGALVVANHISHFDPLLVGTLLLRAGRWPRFVGKSELWSVPLLGPLLRSWRMIPVTRGRGEVTSSMARMAEALLAGDVVVIYPEGTITSDPDGWPMVARTGAARLALATGVPVVPIGQVGADALLGGREILPARLFSLRRRPVALAVGEPLDLRAAFGEHPDEPDVLAAATLIMDAVTDLVAGLRGEPAPRQRWDHRLGSRVSPRGTGGGLG